MKRVFSVVALVFCAALQTMILQMDYWIDVNSCYSVSNSLTSPGHGSLGFGHGRGKRELVHDVRAYTPLNDTHVAGESSTMGFFLANSEGEIEFLEERAKLVGECNRRGLSSVPALEPVSRYRDSVVLKIQLIFLAVVIVFLVAFACARRHVGRSRESPDGRERPRS